MKQINGFIVLSLIVTVGFFCGVLHFLTDFEDGKCEMTYMFESVQFVKVSHKADEKFRQYGLYAYAEGRLTEKARRMYFDGIPVLFIPGNAGSYQQVRSLASIALRKALNSRIGFHFNYFTINLNDEYSGISGSLLNDQMFYVNSSINRVLELYQQNNNRPKSIILVGHSMGGIIAEHLLSTFSNTNNNNLVPILIKLSTPTTRPLLELDYYTREFYNQLKSNDITKTNSVIVSVFGGYNDFLIPPYLVRGNTLNIATTNIPKAWITNDHLSILWCKQVVLAINRALFDAVDFKTKQITTNRTLIESTFKHHLIQHSGTKFHRSERYKQPATIPDRGTWFESLYRQYSVSMSRGTNEIRWYMIRLTDHPLHEMLTVVALNLETVEWVYACPAIHVKNNTRYCKIGTHLTQHSSIFPSARFKRRVFQTNLHEFMKNNSEVTHIVAKVSPTSEPVILQIDIYKASDRQQIITLPSWYKFLSKTEILITDEKAITYDLQLPQLQHVVQYYQLFVEPVRCSGQAYHASVTLTVPWGTENTHGYFTETLKKPFNMRLYNSKPKEFTSENATIHLTLDPTCKFSISVKPTIFGTFAQIARFYSPLLIANVATVILMTFRRQLIGISQEERCSIFFTAISEGAKPYYVLTVAKLASKVLSFEVFAKNLPISDWTILSEEGNDFILLPLILYIVSVGIVWILALSLSIGIVFFESTFNKITLKFLSKTVLGFVTCSDYFMNSIKKIPGLLAIFLVFLAFTTCGGLSICLATGFYFLKLTQMSQDCIESFSWKIAKLVLKFAKSFISENILRRIAKNSEQREKERIENANLLALENTALENEVNKTIGGSVENKKVVKKTAEKSKAVLGNKVKKGYKNVDLIKNGKNNADEKIDDNKLSKDDKIESKDDKKRSEDLAVDKLIRKALRKSSSENSFDSTEENTEESSDSEDIEDIKETSNELLAKQQTETSNTDKTELEKKEQTYSSWFSELFENNEIYFHFSVFLLYLLVAILNLPSVLIWAHNFRYNRTLLTDPSFISGIILSVCALPLWHIEMPKVEKRGYYELSHLFYLSALFAISYCTISLYRLSFVLTGVIVLIVLHQLFAPSKPNSDNNDDDKKDDLIPKEFVDKMRKKWE